ncbi:GIY-YIG nuclease family protein [Candidatus Falkowbacteria bacterium]|nr:GIY-YIG nuclease family protein [Candidatus Falkowbacteria bacterium]
MYYVYLLKSLVRPWHYIGSTDDLRIRFAEHNGGKVKSTKPHRPFELIYYEVYASKTAVRVREVELKINSQQRELLYKRLINLL